MQEVSQTYAEGSIATQQRGKLIVMLYEGAIKFLKVARRKIDEEDYAGKGIYIGKAQDIVAELNNSLDMAAGGQIAGDLRALYNFIYRQLNQANIERDPEKIDECARILRELHGAWEQAVESALTEESDAQAQPERPGLSLQV